MLVGCNNVQAKFISQGNWKRKINFYCFVKKTKDVEGKTKENVENMAQGYWKLIKIVSHNNSGQYSWD